MQLLDVAHFTRKTPQPVGHFMNFVDKPEDKPLTDEEMQAKIDKEVFGL